MRNKKLLIVSSVWVEPRSSAAGNRMLQLIHYFQEWGYEISYASTSVRSDFGFDLREIGVKCRVVRMNCPTFDDFVSELQPDAVLFDRFMIEEQFGWRVSKYCPDALRILDTEDLHCLRDARREAYKKGVEFTETMLFSDVAKREIASIFRCDLTLMISEFEMELLQTFFKVDKSLLFYLPILVTKTEEEAFLHRRTFEERDDFVFIGNFLHEPNWNCVQVLKKEIWPMLSKRLPKANLLIYGAYPSHKVFQLDNPKERFFIKGRAESAAEVIQKARVLLAPIRFGAGIKGKLLEAMLSGTPSVTTTVGAEAMDGGLPWNGSVENDNERFVEKAVELYCNQSVWEHSQQNGYEIIKERFSEGAFLSGLEAKVRYLSKNLGSHRQQNFIGGMLLHHTLQSTYYMAKYIEAKNAGTV